MDESPALGSREALALALATHGLRLRGGFVPDADDQLPELPGGQRVAVVWMVGQVGAECWRHFAASPFLRDGLANPMDLWSRSIGEKLAAPLAGHVLMPSDGPPWYPFQQWALRIGEGLQPTPLQLQLHPLFGLWHAWRFALALPHITPDDAPRLPAVAAGIPSDICARCDGQPCLSACRVQAFTRTGFDAAACRTHVASEQGSDCLAQGCRARRACPVGAEQRYEAAQAAFHVAAFEGGKQP